MSLTNEEVKKISYLARLEYTDEEIEKVGSSFNAILSFLDDLEDLELEHVEPLTHPSNAVNNFRDDIIVGENNMAGIVDQTHEIEKGYLRVPKMLKGAE